MSRELDDSLERLDIFFEIESKGGNKLSKEAKSLINQGYITMDDKGNLGFNDSLLEKYIMSNKGQSVKGNIKVMRDANTHKVFIKKDKIFDLSDKQKTDFVISTLIRTMAPGRASASGRANRMLSGLLSEERGLKVLRSALPQRDIKPIEDDDEFLGSLSLRTDIDFDSLKADTKHFGSLDFIDNQGNLIELKSTGSSIDLDEDANFGMSIENLSKVVYAKILNPRQRKLKIYLEDIKGDVFRLPLINLRLTDIQQRKFDKLIKNKNILNVNDIRQNFKITDFIIREVIRKNNTQIKTTPNEFNAFRQKVPDSANWQLNFKVKDLVLVGRKEVISKEEKVKSFIPTLELDKGLSDKLDEFVQREQIFFNL